jgi:hypothetical protein
MLSLEINLINKYFRRLFKLWLYLRRVICIFFLQHNLHAPSRSLEKLQQSPYLSPYSKSRG